LASVSDFSAKVGTDSVGDGDGEAADVIGEPEALGAEIAAGVLLSVVRPGVALGATGAGGGRWVAE
jgi:hypothetical protein